VSESAAAALNATLAKIEGGAAATAGPAGPTLAPQDPRPGMWCRERAHAEQDDDTVRQGPVVDAWREPDGETGELRWRLCYLPTVRGALLVDAGQVPRRAVWADDVELSDDSPDAVVQRIVQTLGRTWARKPRARLTRNVCELVDDMGRMVLERHRRDGAA
jgi:hypothetical protein